MGNKKPIAALPVLSSDALDKVHRITEKCRAKLRIHEHHWSSSVNRDKAREITSTYAVEEFNVRVEDYVSRYDLSPKLVSKIIDVTIKSILASFPTATFPDGDLENDLRAVLEGYVRQDSNIKIPSGKNRQKSEAISPPTIGEQIRRLSDECRLTQEEMAEELGISHRSVARHLAGDSRSSKRHIRAYETLFSKKSKCEIRLKTS